MKMIDKESGKRDYLFFQRKRQNQRLEESQQVVGDLLLSVEEEKLKKIENEFIEGVKKHAVSPFALWVSKNKTPELYVAKMKKLKKIMNHLDILGTISMMPSISFLFCGFILPLFIFKKELWLLTVMGYAGVVFAIFAMLGLAMKQLKLSGWQNIENLECVLDPQKVLDNQYYLQLLKNPEISALLDKYFGSSCHWSQSRVRLVETYVREKNYLLRQEELKQLIHQYPAQKA